MKPKEKLPKTFKTKWLIALRSGKYKQSEGRLEWIGSEGDKSHCCLGVACRIVHPNIKITKESFISLKALKVPNMLRGDNDLTLKLANMNDQGDSFKDIAKWIEKNL